MLAIYFMDIFTFTHDSQSITTYFFTESRRTDNDGVLDPITGNLTIDSMDLVQLESRRDLGEDVITRKAYFKRVRALARAEAIELTDKLLQRRQTFRASRSQRRLETRGKFIAESKELGDMALGDADNAETYQNVQDYAGETPVTYSLGKSLHSINDGGDTQLSLDQFFERPISIYDSTFNSGTEYNVALKVWNLWANDASVRAKLANYSYFKGDLHIKIATTGTPYHYGRLMASYQPYAKFNDMLRSYDTLIGATVPTVTEILPAYKCYLSQAPGVAYIDVKENEPIILDVPFISPKPKYRLFNSSNLVITNATSFVDFEEAGELRFVTLNKLQVANEDYDSDISINIFAWMTNVELGSLTSTDMNITAQSKVISYHTEARRRRRRRRSPSYDSESEDEAPAKPKSLLSKVSSGVAAGGEKVMAALKGGGDEYSEPGPVTTIATAVSKIGNTLSDIPIIGPFAKATSTIAGTVGKVAGWFGWAKPLVLTDPTYVKHLPFMNGAVTIGKDTPFKISVDPKQELSVDQSLGGVEEDQMSILAISSRESFLTSFTWADTDVALTTILWGTLVTPYLFQQAEWTSTGAQGLVQPTAMMFAAQPFNSWRGKINFRFEVVCSKFHRGKLLFKFEPNFAMEGLISSGSTKLNQQNTVILDIQNGQEVSFEVDWAHVRNWCAAPESVQANSPPCDLEGQAASYVSHLETEVNGFLEVRALNELVQPADLADVQINVYVCCKDLQVNRPSKDIMPATRLLTYTESKEINPTGSKADEKIFLDHYGEKIFSFRSLLKRYQTTGIAYQQNSVVGMGTIKIDGTLYPFDGLPTATSPPNTTVPTALFNYLRYGFMGVRGGYRFRVIMQTESSINQCYTRVKLMPDADMHDTKLGITFASIQDVGSYQNANYLSDIDGTLLFHMGTNGGIEFEIPYYSHNLFNFAFDVDFGAQTGDELAMGTLDSHCQSWLWEVHTSGQLANTNKTVVTTDTASAEDFTFLRFQGAPFFTESLVIIQDISDDPNHCDLFPDSEFCNDLSDSDSELSSVFTESFLRFLDNDSEEDL